MVQKRGEMQMKKYLLMTMLFIILFSNKVYATSTINEVFLTVDEQYVMEYDSQLLYNSENEEIATVDEGIIIGRAVGDTYLVVDTEDGVERKIHVYVGDYKLCVGQESLMKFDLSSIINAWGASAKSSNESVISVTKQGYKTNNAEFLFKAVSTGIANITIETSYSKLKSFTMVVQNHPLVYFEHVKSTCSKEGSIAHYKCLFCNKCYSDSSGLQPVDDISVEKENHQYMLSDKQEATCDEDGFKEYTCVECQDKYTETILAGHIYESKIVKADCINKGYTVHTCARCGETYNDSYENALEHNYIPVSYMNYNSILQKQCNACKDITYEMNIDGAMVDGRLYQVYWKEKNSEYYVPLNQECQVTTTFSSSTSVSVDIIYKQPIRASSGKLKIYDVKMLYEDTDTKQVKFDNAINNISFSYYDVYSSDDEEVEVGYGMSRVELSMNYNEDDEDDTGYLSYSYECFPEIGNKYYKILGVTFKLKFESNDKNPYSKIPVQEIELSKEKLTIAKGISKKLKVVYDSKTEYIDGSLKWTSSNKKIATVSSSGKVKAKKPGKCTITCKLPNGAKAKCKITVKKNEYKGISLSKCNAHDGRYGNIHFEVNKAYYKGNTFVLKCVVMNTRILRAVKFNWITIVPENDDGQVIAKKKFKNVPINVTGYGKKYITFTFPKSAVKKKRDLHKGVYIDPDYVYTYSY